MLYADGFELFLNVIVLSVFNRDASFGTCMYNLNILDCLCAIYKVPRFSQSDVSLTSSFAVAHFMKCKTFCIAFHALIEMYSHKMHLQALQFGWLDFSQFDVEEYEHYEVSFHYHTSECRLSKHQ